MYPGGLYLSDLPSEGLLQFVIMEGMFHGAENETWESPHGAQTFYRTRFRHRPVLAQSIGAGCCQARC